jgi:murein DD-endopeptidase MepM/ murein hydrolase activator NlpD
VPCRALAVSLLLFAVLAPPARASSSGGAVYSPAAARGFAVAPGGAPAGVPLRFTFRALTPGRRVPARVDFRAGGRTVAHATLGRVRSRRMLSLRWTPRAGVLPPGAYSVRLVLGGRTAAHASFAVVAPPPPLPAPPAAIASATGVFPVQGPYTFGDPFGVGRPGHIHQGQDVAAASGTPIVAPLSGTVVSTAYQASGAGYYVVLHGADGRDYVFMHLLTGSTAVAKAQAVSAGQRLGLVGATGDATGPHLHFEIWPDGWYASKTSQPIDPLPQLQAWAAT